MGMTHVELKKIHPDKILFFKTRDFYLVFNGDAQLFSAITGIPIQNKREVREHGITPLTGFEHSDLEVNVKIMNNAGYTVALLEFVSETGSDESRRKITRIFKPNGA